ncbi:Inner membrane protein YrbG, predicted calcium/sodium:proton antiporter [hydrothermal vent metagenome]|uniref:Inner membrane protein YrbG, predicted calcium/sodium:proton antiporter n=1 Tax=hydrothermal vent metagenome TaxID=652676 RepID=A0A3B1BZS9_9ZZZZ
MNNEILLSIAAVLSGFILLVWGAERFVHGAAALARNLGVSPLIIGLTIVGIGTSAPEILVSAIAAWEGNPAIGVGNALGSNIANIALVLGMTALISPLRVSSQTLRREYPVMFLIMIIALMLVLDGQLTRVDGAILLIGLVIMLKWMITLGMKEKKDPLELEYEHEIPHITTGKAIFWLSAGMILLLFSSRILVWGAVNIAHALGVSDLIIGLTVVAIGTSMPELAASIMSALKKEHDIAIGNIIGSNMFNLLAVLGLPGLIAPHVLDPAVLTRDFPWMIGLSIALFIFAYGFRGEGRINRWEGLLLLCSYFVYLGVLYFDTSKNMHGI